MKITNALHTAHYGPYVLAECMLPDAVRVCYAGRC